MVVDPLSSIIGDPRSISSSVLSLDLMKVGDFDGFVAFWVGGGSVFVQIQAEAYILTLITLSTLARFRHLLPFA